MSALWNSLTNSAHVVCSVLTSATPVVTANCWTESRTSLVHIRDLGPILSRQREAGTVNLHGRALSTWSTP